MLLELDSVHSKSLTQTSLTTCSNLIILMIQNFQLPFNIYVLVCFKSLWYASDTTCEEEFADSRGG